MDDLTTTAGLLTAIVPLIAYVVELLRKKDTNQHGDAFIDMLKRGVETMDTVAGVIPALQVYADEGREIVAEAASIWESSGFTAQNMKLIQYKYDVVQRQIARDIEKMRALKKE